VVGGGEVLRLHLVEGDSGTLAGSLPGRFAAGQAAADDDDVIDFLSIHGLWLYAEIERLVKPDDFPSFALLPGMAGEEDSAVEKVARSR
jgi:hypothetical protein